MDTNITILQLKILKQIRRNTAALIYLALHGYVAKWIKHEASGMLTFCKMSSNLVTGRFFITFIPVHRTYHHISFVDCCHSVQ